MLSESKLEKLIKILNSPNGYEAESNERISDDEKLDLVSNYCDFKNSYPNNKYVLEIGKTLKNIELRYYKDLYTYLNTNNPFIYDVMQNYLLDHLDNVKYLVLEKNNYQKSDAVNQIILKANDSDLLTLFVEKNFSDVEIDKFKKDFLPLFSTYHTLVSWKFGRKYLCDNPHFVPSNPDKITNNLTVDSSNNYAKGDYGEKLVYENLNQKSPSSRNIWVSRDIGDGYGFDIIKINDINNAELIEVKSTSNKNTYDNDNIFLSSNEGEIMKEAENTPGTKYSVYKVYIDLNNLSLCQLQEMSPDNIKVKSSNEAKSNERNIVAEVSKKYNEHDEPEL